MSDLEAIYTNSFCRQRIGSLVLIYVASKAAKYKLQWSQDKSEAIVVVSISAVGVVKKVLASAANYNDSRFTTCLAAILIFILRLGSNIY